MSYERSQLGRGHWITAAHLRRESCRIHLLHTHTIYQPLKMLTFDLNITLPDFYKHLLIISVFYTSQEILRTLNPALCENSREQFLSCCKSVNSMVVLWRVSAEEASSRKIKKYWIAGEDKRITLMHYTVYLIFFFFPYEGIMNVFYNEVIKVI